MFFFVRFILNRVKTGGDVLARLFNWSAVNDLSLRNNPAVVSLDF